VIFHYFIQDFIQARFWVISGPFFGRFFSTVFDLDFGPLFLGMPFDVKRRAGLAKLRFGPLF
jgi:hypothetical protein